MLRSFDLRALRLPGRAAHWREPRTIARAIVGLLIALNLVAAAFAFHLFGKSPAQVRQDVLDTQLAILKERTLVQSTRMIAEKVQKGRAEGDRFLTSYMTPRRTTYSAIVGELQREAANAGMTLREANISPLDPVKGSEDLSMMTVSATFEGSFPQLVKFINALDKSERFLIIESLTSAPQANGTTLNAQLKLNTFVRGDTGDQI